VKTNKNVIGII